MSQTESGASDAELGEPESDSVYDFLYHDARRVGSYLAQFDDAGLLQQVTQSEGAYRGSKRGWKAAAGGSIPAVGTINVSAERGPERGGFEASERVYDAFWTNARTLLDFLDERGMVRRDLTEARIGQFVLVSGALTMLDVTLFKGLWDLPGIRALMLEGAKEQAAANAAQQRSTQTPQVEPLNRAERRSQGKQKQQATTEDLKNDQVISAAFSFVGMLPHVVQAWLIVDEGAQIVWSSLQQEGMVTPPADLVLKHGTTISGNCILDVVGSKVASGERQAGAEIEVTEEMIEAGVKALCQCDLMSDYYRDMARLIYTEMEKVRRT